MRQAAPVCVCGGGGEQCDTLNDSCVHTPPLPRRGRWGRASVRASERVRACDRGFVQPVIRVNKGIVQPGICVGLVPVSSLRVA